MQFGDVVEAQMFRTQEVKRRRPSGLTFGSGSDLAFHGKLQLVAVNAVYSGPRSNEILVFPRESRIKGTAVRPVRVTPTPADDHKSGTR